MQCIWLKYKICMPVEMYAYKHILKFILQIISNYKL